MAMIYLNCRGKQNFFNQRKASELIFLKLPLYIVNINKILFDLLESDIRLNFIDVWQRFIQRQCFQPPKCLILTV